MVGNVDAVAGAEEIATGPRDLVGLRPDRPRTDVDPDGAAGDIEGECDVDALFFSDLLLIECQDDLEAG